MAKKFSRLLEGMSEERRALIRAEAEEMIQETALAELRRARSLTQTELANRRPPAQHCRHGKAHGHVYFNAPSSRGGHGW